MFSTQKFLSSKEYFVCVSRFDGCRILIYHYIYGNYDGKCILIPVLLHYFKHILNQVCGTLKKY